MKMKNIVEFKIEGKFALFTDPLTKLGGEKYSYQIPTYESLKGILSSIYWKPTITWIINKIRVMRPIRTQTRNARPLNYGGGNTLAIYTYLADVEYQVQAHFEWNINREDMIQDRNENKHYFVAKRMIERGGRRDVFLGTRECQAYVEPCVFGEGEGFYDTYPGEITYGLMFHGFDYPDETGRNELHARFWYPKMDKGIVEFFRPEDCTNRKLVRSMTGSPPISIGLGEVVLLEGFEEGQVRNELDSKTI
jgi:CRISPR-associated protein Cas5d